MGFDAARVTAKERMDEDTKVLAYYHAYTDWIGPYIVGLQADREKNLVKHFTGGWHGSNGDSTGDPTAATVDVKLLVDGEERASIEEPLQGNIIDLYVTNFIQGYDTTRSKQPILKEVVHYEIFPSHRIVVNVEIEALEDIVIYRYYGMQSRDFSDFDTVSYYTDGNLMKSVALDKRSDSGMKKINAGVNHMLLNSTESPFFLHLIMDNGYGLGTKEYVKDTAPGAFTTSYKKSYFNLVYGKELFMSKGGTKKWRGAYLWGMKSW